MPQFESSMCTWYIGSSTHKKSKVMLFVYQQNSVHYSNTQTGEQIEMEVDDVVLAVGAEALNAFVQFPKNDDDNRFQIFLLGQIS